MPGEDTNMAKENIKVALVHDWLTGFAGAEQVLLALHEIFPEAPIYTSVWNKEKTPQFSQATVIPSYLQKFPGAIGHHQLFIPLMPQAFESFDFKGFDVIISITTGLSKGIITQPDQLHIAYCNTPPRYLWRLGNDTRNEGRLDSGLRNWISHKLRIWDIVSADRVDAFLANSHTVAERVAKIYRKPSTVIYPPVNTNRFSPSDKKPGNYMLSVGRLVEYKRVDLIIQACLAAGCPLKIAGEGPERSKLEQLAAGHPTIEFLGRVPDADLKELYGQALAFIFAAEEDFGIVPVEAMSAGRPVIAYRKGGATETVEDGITGLFFDQQTPDSLATVLRTFQAEQFDSQRIRRHAEKFDKKVFQTKFADFVSSQWQKMTSAKGK